jgi:hypothetical protein
VTGEVLGSISDFVIDEEGRIAFVALYHGEGYDYEYGGGKYVAIPFTAFSISREKPDEISVVLNIDKKRLESTPGFDRRSDLIDRAWAEDTYRHFGQQPYWTEGEKEEVSPMKSWPEDVIFYAP